MKSSVFVVAVLSFILVESTALCGGLIGLGYGSMTLPSNDDEFGMIGPDGEKTGAFNIYASSGKKEKIGFGGSFSGYTLKKSYTDASGYAVVDWSVYHINLYLEYRAPLGEKETSPSLGIRAGGSIVPVKLSAELSDNNYYLSDSDKSTEFGPYVGIDLQIPIANSPFAAFILAEKTFAKYEDDVNVGSMVFGGGIAIILK